MKEIKIGNQIWMAENLNLETFRNGDQIPEAKTEEQWKEAARNKQPACCYFGNNSSKGINYGRLYNWFALIDHRNIAPEGWRVASDGDWLELITFAGGMEFAGSELKSKTYDWVDSGYGLDTFGFGARPGGSRFHDGTFSPFGWKTYFWSATGDESDNYGAWSYGFDGLKIPGADFHKKVEKSFITKEWGMYVMLIKYEI